MIVRLFSKITALVAVLAAGSAVFAQASWPCGATPNDKVTATLNAEGVLTISGTGKMKDRTNEQAQIQDKQERSQKYMKMCDEQFRECMRFANTSRKAEDCRGGRTQCEMLKGTDIEKLMLAVNDLDDALRGKVTTTTKDGSMPYDGYLDAVTKVVIENGVTSVGGMAFAGMANLTSVSIGNSVKSIGYIAFGLCEKLTSITIPNSVVSIESQAFLGCSGIASITIPNSVKTIGNDVFHGCTGLTSVTIGNSVVSINSGTFYACAGLTSITIPNSVTSIGDAAFAKCTGLASITIPASVTSIGENAFHGCARLKSVTIPNNVTVIGKSVFDSSGIAFITMLNPTPPQINANTFKGIDTTSCVLFVPEGSIYKLANHWKKFRNIRFGRATEEVILAEQQKVEDERRVVQQKIEDERRAVQQKIEDERKARQQRMGAFNDIRDGKTYKTVQMPDGKTWMAENLNFDPGKKGDSQCDDCAKYGRVYSWKTALKVCPTGWHLPTSEEWDKLVESTGGKVAATKLKSKDWEKSINYYNIPGGTDYYGFSALPGGGKVRCGNFSSRIIGRYSSWWTATDNYYRFVYTDSEEVGEYSCGEMLSVRCVQNK